MQTIIGKTKKVRTLINFVLILTCLWTQLTFGQSAKIVQVAEDVFLIEDLGCNVLAVTGSEGVLLIDTGAASNTDRLEAALDELDAGPVLFVLNTHFHFDHVGSNQYLAQRGAVIIAHEKTRERMQAEWNVPEMLGIRYPVIPPYPSSALPKMVFWNNFKLYFGGQEIELIHFGRAHSDADVAIFLRDRNVLHTGDLYLSNGFPAIDIYCGGSVDGTLSVLDSLAAAIDDETKVVPGHGPVVGRNDLLGYRTMLAIAKERVLALIKEGKTLEEIAAADPIADLYPGKSWLTPNLFIFIVYMEAKGKN